MLERDLIGVVHGRDGEQHRRAAFFLQPLECQVSRFQVSRHAKSYFRSRFFGIATPDD
jgi:hypothetical protein